MKRHRRKLPPKEVLQSEIKVAGTSMDPPKSPLKAIRFNCLDCSGGSAQEVNLCPVETCPLWGFRFGRKPGTVASKVERELENMQENDEEDDE